MKYDFSIKIIVGLVVAVVTCAVSGCTSPASDDASRPNILVVAEGDVQLKRATWSDFHPTTFGTELHDGDQLRLNEGVRAVVLCDDLNTWAVPAGAPAGLSNGCSQSTEQVLKHNESSIGGTRAGQAALLIPYIISPRDTKLNDDKPILRWNSVAGASQYRVIVQGTGLKWEAKVKDNETVYPGDPPLKPGVTYSLIVTTDNGATSVDEEMPGLGFSLLAEADAARVSAAKQKIHALSLSDEAEAFALAQLYSGFDLRAAAIEMLEELVGKSSQESAVYRMLGDLYRKIGLYSFAESSYTTAVFLAQSAGDIESQATARVGQAEVKAAQGNTQEAIDLLNQARDGFQLLGDAIQVKGTIDSLAEMKKAMTDKPTP